MTQSEGDQFEFFQEAGTVIDFSGRLITDLSQIDFRQLTKITVHLPLPSFGSSNSHIDLAGDLLDACWALEKLSACAEQLEVSLGSGYYQPTIEVKLHGLHANLRETLIDCALVFLEDSFDAGRTDRTQSLRSDIADFKDILHTIAPAHPETVDHYFGNLVASYGEWKSENSEYYLDQVRRFPERRTGYFRSAHSFALNGNCYASEDGWIVASSVDLDDFFVRIGQAYRLKDFIPAQLAAVQGQTVVLAESMLVEFPVAKYLKSQVASCLAIQDDEDEYFSTAFTLAAWEFVIARNGAIAQETRDGVVGDASYSGCFIHATGTLLFVDDGRFRHLIYETTPLNLVATKVIHEAAVEITAALSAATGVSAELRCEWIELSDEQFEELCYDLIYLNPKFDTDSIRKHGKSRSRDGGRDIEVWEHSTWHNKSPRKWIFQCKLVKNGASLGATKLADVGDMLEHYNAGGFGVMTSAPIDATLYDKLDAICGRRQVKQYHFSRLELERALARHHNVKKRYFRS